MLFAINLACDNQFMNCFAHLLINLRNAILDDHVVTHAPCLMYGRLMIKRWGREIARCDHDRKRLGNCPHSVCADVTSPFGVAETASLV